MGDIQVTVGNVLELSDATSKSDIVHGTQNFSGDERRRNLQAHVQDLLLALKTDVGGPADHAAEVALGLDVLANAIVARPLLDERVLS